MTLRSISSKCCLFNLQFALRRQRGEAKPSSLVAPFSRAKMQAPQHNLFLVCLPPLSASLHCANSRETRRRRHNSNVTCSHRLAQLKRRKWAILQSSWNRNAKVLSQHWNFYLNSCTCVENRSTRQQLKPEKLFSQIGSAQFTLSCKANFAQTRNATENMAKSTS